MTLVMVVCYYENNLQFEAGMRDEGGSSFQLDGIFFFRNRSLY